jgi:hypothetical protein
MHATLVNRFLTFTFLILLTLSFGCSFYEERPSTDEQVHVGVISVTNQNKTDKFKFKYTQRSSDDFEVALYPFFVRPIILKYCNNQYYLNLHGTLYEGEQAVECLHAFAPDFPWDRLPYIVNQGLLDSAQWHIGEWTPGSFEIHGMSSSLKWKTNQIY